jgi:outer membrane protein
MNRMTLVVVLTALTVAGNAFAQTGTQQQTPPVQNPPAQNPPVPAAPPPQLPTPPVPFPVDAKIAFIDLQAIVAQSQIGKAGQKQMQALSEKKSADLADKTKKIQALQQEIQQQTTLLSPAALTAKNNELDRMQREFQFAQQDAQAEVENLNQQLMTGFQDKVLPIVDALGKEKNLHAVFVLDRDNTIVAYVHPGLDLTSEVVKRLDAKYPAAAIK